VEDRRRNEIGGGRGSVALPKMARERGEQQKVRVWREREKVESGAAGATTERRQERTIKQIRSDSD